MDHEPGAGTGAAAWEWQRAALCRGIDSSLFFAPDGERGPERDQREQRATSLCASCPVLEPCATHARVAKEPYGTWGGITEAERREARRTSSRRLDL